MIEIELNCAACGHGPLEGKNGYVRRCENCEENRKAELEAFDASWELREQNLLDKLRLLKREIFELKGQLVAIGGITELYRLGYQEPLVWGVPEAI